MLADTLETVLAFLSGLPPITGFFAVIVATFILEDVAIVATALLAATGMMEPSAGLTALLIGIVVGDMGLFGLGYGAARMPGLRRYVDSSAAQRVRSLGKDRIFSLVVSTRFLPGMRLPTYTSLGYVGASFWRFCQAVLIAVSVWTVALFFAVFYLGRNILLDVGPWKYAAIAAVILLVYLAERWLVKRRKTAALLQDQG
ncbi:MAG: VTT domain-containing protein [Pseudomonadota bacterium]